jgi:hypothetical protein
MKLKEIGTSFDIKNSSWVLLETEDIRVFVDEYLKE